VKAEGQDPSERMSCRFFEDKICQGGQIPDCVPSFTEWLHGTHWKMLKRDLRESFADVLMNGE